MSFDHVGAGHFVLDVFQGVPNDQVLVACSFALYVTFARNGKHVNIFGIFVYKKVTWRHKALMHHWPVACIRRSNTGIFIYIKPSLFCNGLWYTLKQKCRVNRKLGKVMKFHHHDFHKISDYDLIIERVAACRTSRAILTLHPALSHCFLNTCMYQT